MLQVLQLKQEKEHLIVVERKGVQRLEVQEVKFERLRAQNAEVIAETSRLRAKLSAAYAQLRTYQHQLRSLAASSELQSQALPAVEMGLHEGQATLQSLQHHMHHVDIVEQLEGKLQCSSDAQEVSSEGTGGTHVKMASATTASIGTQV